MDAASTPFPRFARDTLAGWSDVLAALPGEDDPPLAWVEGPLREFFPFRRFLWACAEMTAGEVRIERWIASGHDPAYFEQLNKTFEVTQRRSLATWLATRRPILIDPDRVVGDASEFELDEIRRFGLRNVAAHGVLNLRSNAGSYFSFSGFDEPLSPWHAQVLALIVPTLSDLFMRFHARDVEPTCGLAAQALTARQRDVVRLVAAGYDNKTIGARLTISEKTVRNQLSQVFERLGVQSRTQLIERLR